MEEKKLYRIISLEGFLSLLVNEKERFVRPIDCWEDTYEGYMLQLLDSEDGSLSVLERLYLLDNNPDIIIRNYTKLFRSRYTCYGLCWSMNRDSDALWRIYSYNLRGIQLISTKQCIESMLLNAKVKKSDFTISDVKYDIEDEESAISKILYKAAPVDKAYFYKRPAFSHENEVRVLLKDTNRTQDLEAFSNQAIRINYQRIIDCKSVPERIQKAINKLNLGKDYKNVMSTELHIPIKNMSEYVIGVRVHPQAPDWYVELIRKICLQYTLNFEGKSDLYRTIKKKSS